VSQWDRWIRSGRVRHLVSEQVAKEDVMGVVQGVLLAGAAANGLVVVERVRRRGSSEDVRSDVTELGTTVADQVGRAAGFVGHASGKVLGKSSEVAESLADRTTHAVSGAGRTIARGTGATLGAYAGAIDRVVPSKGKDQPPATTSTATAAKSAPAKRATTKAKAS
jgi:hypothetical protein